MFLKKNWGHLFWSASKFHGICPFLCSCNGFLNVIDVSYIRNKRTNVLGPHTFVVLENVWYRLCELIRRGVKKIRALNALVGGECKNCWRGISSFLKTQLIEPVKRRWHGTGGVKKGILRIQIVAEQESVERKFGDVGFAWGVLKQFFLLVRLEHRAKNLVGYQLIVT